MKLEYELNGNGSARVRFVDGGKTVESRVTNQHDSLLDLLQAAIAIRDGARRARAVFVVDPGELHLELEVEDGLVDYEVRRFAGWASIEGRSDAEHAVLLRGSTTPAEIVAVVIDLATRLEEGLGSGRYEALWQQHAFPTAAFEKLVDRKRPARQAFMRRLNLAIRLLLIVTVAPGLYYLVYNLSSTLFWIYNIAWVPHTIALLVALETGWLIWTRLRPVDGIPREQAVDDPDQLDNR